MEVQVVEDKACLLVDGDKPFRFDDAQLEQVVEHAFPAAKDARQHFHGPPHDVGFLLRDAAARDPHQDFFQGVDVFFLGVPLFLLKIDAVVHDEGSHRHAAEARTRILLVDRRPTWFLSIAFPLFFAQLKECLVVRFFADVRPLHHPGNLEGLAHQRAALVRHVSVLVMNAVDVVSCQLAPALVCDVRV